MAVIENLTVWNQAVLFAKNVYKLCEHNVYLKNNFGLRDQIQRSVVSIPSNIAEGTDRWTQKEFAKFLFIARGSCSELKTQLYLLKELSYIDDTVFKQLLDDLTQIHKMINAFIKKIHINP